MDIVFLGTASGTPTKQRNVSGLALSVESSNVWYLIDCGEATQHQLLRTPISLTGLEAIFVTHVHGDHCYGLPGLLASIAMSGRKKPLPIIAPRSIDAWIKTTQQLTEMFLPFDLQFIATESIDLWKDSNMIVEVVPLSHRVPSYAYCFTEAQVKPILNITKLVADDIPQGPIWGCLKTGKDVLYQEKTLSCSNYLSYPYTTRTIIVAGDNDQPELLREKCGQAHVLIHESTYTQDIAIKKIGAGYKHSSAATVATFAESVKLPNLLLTHFSSRYQSDVGKSPSIQDIRAEAATHYHGQLFIAEDLARYRLTKTGQLIHIL